MPSLVGAITTLGLLGLSANAPVYDPDYGAAPTFPRPYEATWTGLGLSALPGVRAVDFSGKSELTTAPLDVSDTASLSATEDPIDTNEIVTTDTARLSATESTQLFNFRSTTDTASLSVSETIGLVQSGVTLKTASDTATLSVTESVAVGVTIDVTDTASLTVSESVSVSTTAETVDVTDTATLTVDESLLLAIFAGVVELNAQDTALLTTSEIASAIEVRRIKRITLSIRFPRITMEIV